MNKYKILLIIGNLLLAIGILMAVFSFHYNSKVMGKASLGIGLIAPDEGSPEWKEKEKTRKISVRLFYTGIVITFIGIGFQTFGVLLDKTP